MVALSTESIGLLQAGGLPTAVSELLNEYGALVGKAVAFLVALVVVYLRGIDIGASEAEAIPSSASADD